jgi:F-type H+-transporting ATPase subunit beta
MSTTTSNRGVIKQIIGPVVDVHFAQGVPNLKNALTITREDGSVVTLEVAQHVGLDRVRAIAMDDTQGLKRDMDVVDTGAPISVPVGEKALGRLMNVLGHTLDGKGDITDSPTLPIHREAPHFTEQATKTEVFETALRL